MISVPVWMLAEWALASAIFLIVFIYGFHVSAKVIRTIHGGKYATATPYLLVGLGVLLMMQLLYAFFHVISPIVVHSVMFQFGAQTLQIVAGAFFIKAFYQVYQMSYATSAMMDE